MALRREEGADTSGADAMTVATAAAQSFDRRDNRRCRFNLEARERVVR